MTNTKLPTDDEIKEWAESHFPVLQKNPNEVTYDEMKSYERIIPEIEGMIKGAKWIRDLKRSY